VHLSAFITAFRTPDLRKKLLFTLALIGLYRLGSVIPTPGVDYGAIQRCLDTVQESFGRNGIHPGSNTGNKGF